MLSVTERLGQKYLELLIYHQLRLIIFRGFSQSLEAILGMVKAFLFPVFTHSLSTTTFMISIDAVLVEPLGS
jgi:hypothetical protein